MEKIADLLTKFMISESSSENLDYEVCKFGLLMAIEVAINTVIALCISFLLGMFRYGILFLTFFIAKSICRWSAFGKILELYSVIRYGFEYGFTYRKICCYTVYFFICFMCCYGNSNFYCWPHR